MVYDYGVQAKLGTRNSGDDKRDSKARITRHKSEASAVSVYRCSTHVWLGGLVVRPKRSDDYHR